MNSTESQIAKAASVSMSLANTAKNDKAIFWGCFIALITTSFAFITRAFLVNDPSLWPAQFGLDNVQSQELFQAGIWPFAISIILFSLIIDKVGYRAAMYFSFICYVLYAVMALMAYQTIHVAGLEGEALAAAQEKAYKLLYTGSIILGLGNGTVEAFINPVVATLYKSNKSKWLNILHAGWPGGLVIGGLITIGLTGAVQNDWRILVYFIAAPAVVYLVMLGKARFPVNERVEAGASYRDMLAEFGAIGAALASYFIFMQLGLVFSWPLAVVVALVVVTTVGYYFYCRSLGNPVLIVLCLIMMPLATTEIGTDSAIGGIMEEPLTAEGWSPLWVLVYTSLIMVILRFNVGPIVQRVSPLGLLAGCSLLAILGLFFLSRAQDLGLIFVAATLYGVGKSYFWPTILGVAAEQTPKGGALTLNAIAAIGMLTVGTIGGPLIGKMQEDSAVIAVQAKQPEIAAEVISEESYILGKYIRVDEKKVAMLQVGSRKEVEDAIKLAKQGSLAKITIFPFVMFLGFLGLILYFKSKGGYRAVELQITEPEAPVR